MVGRLSTFLWPYFQGQINGCPHGKRKKITGARLTIQEGSTKSCKNCIKLFPYAPWAWNIYLSLLQVYGTCRQIFHTWGASGIRSNTLNNHPKSSWLRIDIEVRLKQLMSHFVVQEFQEKTHRYLHALHHYAINWWVYFWKVSKEFLIFFTSVQLHSGKLT